MSKTPDLIINEYLYSNDLSHDALMGRCRTHDLVLHRMALAKLLRKAGLTYPRIGQLMHRDHATIMYYLKKDYRERCKSRGKA